MSPRPKSSVPTIAGAVLRFLAANADRAWTAEEIAEAESLPWSVPRERLGTEQADQHLERVRAAIDDCLRDLGGRRAVLKFGGVYSLLMKPDAAREYANYLDALQPANGPTGELRRYKSRPVNS